MTPYVYIVALGQSNDDLLRSFSSGADDYVRLPFDRAELVARLLAAERIRSHLATKQEPVDEFLNKLTLATAWVEIESRTSSELAAMLAVQCRPLAATSDGSAAHVVELAFTLAEQRTAVTLYLAADADSLSGVATQLLGAPETAASVLDEVAFEVLNTLGGAFKRATLASQLDYTTGLPKLASLESMHHATRTAAFFKTWDIAWQDHRVTLLATIRRQDNCSVAVERLCEGMVLSSEVRNGSGALLVASGTRLTEAAIAHIRKALGKKAQLLVSQGP
jgi:hypothetical protein